jgi:uncharacterized LabA/DUF88 family protein
MNTAFIDGQNLHLGTREAGFIIDHKKFRTYLRDKYHVEEAYYFLGFVRDEQHELYDKLQKVGFILSFRDHSSLLLGKKKGNVDCDIVFSVMKRLYEDTLTGNVVVVSGDGDYKKLVDYLVKIQRFEKVLFPNKKYASSLYKHLGS